MHTPTEAKEMTADFDKAYASLKRLGMPDLLPTLHQEGLQIRRDVLGGSHSVAVYPPIDSLEPVDSNHVFDTINFGHDTSLYVHIPFCETRCTFCHYTVQHYSGKRSASPTSNDSVAQYLEVLKLELKLWGRRLARSRTILSSIYIGGGTPLILEEEALLDIIGAINEIYEVDEGAEICIEGSPLTITAAGGRDKLRLLREQGFTRLSFGVQSFDDEVLKHAGRGYKSDIAISAAEIASEIFDNWNLDLIQGLYKGSPTEVWQNLQIIEKLRPAHLTWYHGRFADRPQGDWYRSTERQNSFEDESAILVGRMMIWQGMASLGYHQIDGNRFVRDRLYTDPFKKVRTSSSRDLLGVGVASYSHIGAKLLEDDCHGYVFRNGTNMRTYNESILSGQMAIETARAINDEELLAMSYATGLRSDRIGNAELNKIEARKPQLAAQYRMLTRRLIDVGILEKFEDGDKEGLRLSELGRLFEDETLALFFSPTVKRAVMASVNE